MVARGSGFSAAKDARSVSRGDGNQAGIAEAGRKWAAANNDGARAFLIFHHAVLIAEARRRRGDRAFRAMLLRWAGNRRRELAALPRQRDLFP